MAERRSPSPSSATAPSDPPRKRTRASKPKVKSGCLTWCVRPKQASGTNSSSALTSPSSKIRRVKCGEEKPACFRCTSTGRTCDGYGNAALARGRSPGSNQPAELAKVEFVRACQSSKAFRPIRPSIQARIDGTESEKNLLALFRDATANGTTTTHPCILTPFWRRLAASTGAEDEAVQHAVVALSAAHQLSQHPGRNDARRSDLEVLTIQQYNASIELLQRRHVDSAAPESVRVTLLCCLAFVSLESLRGNNDVAVAHLVNGLRILQSLPDSAFDCLDSAASADPDAYSRPPVGAPLRMPDIIHLFAQLEVPTCCTLAAAQQQQHASSAELPP